MPSPYIPSIVLNIPNGVRFRLSLAAENRGVTLNQLVRCILERVVDDKLIDAVLDDMT